jgi:ribose/xylose/arabinose/galactoside ABC-type transport system permease subunit
MINPMRAESAADVRSGEALRTRRRRVPNLQALGVYLALGVIWVVLSFASPYFFTLDNISNLLIAASTMCLIGAGLTVVLIAGEIDLAFAAMQAFTGAVAAILITKLHLFWPVGIVLAMAIATGSAVLTGIITVIGRLPTFITTLALLGIVQGVAFLLTEGEPRSGFPDAYLVLGSAFIGIVPVSIIIVVVVYALLFFVMNYTTFGLDVYAVGGNRAAAQLLGISPNRVVISVLGLSGFLASIAGIIISSRLGAGSGTYGANDLLPVVAGVIIGGTSLTGGRGSLMGTLGGVMITVTISDGLVLLNVSQYWTQVIIGVIIMLAVLLDQTVRGQRITALLSRLRPGAAGALEE